jgi:uncharacterized protein (DUF1778 family)
MNATVNVSLRIPTAQARAIKKAAAQTRLKLGTWIREAAILMAETNPELRRFPLTPELERAPK